VSARPRGQAQLIGEVFSRSRSWSAPSSAFAGFRFPPEVIAGHAFVQNLRRGHYEIATETPAQQRLAAAFTELATAI
jgi:transposase, IS6 family